MTTEPIPQNVVGPHSSSTLLFDNSFITLGGITIQNGIHANDIHIGTTVFVATPEHGVCFEIGHPRNQNGIFPDISNSQFTSTDYDVNIGITSGTLNCNAFQLIDRWLDVYYLDTPPAPSLGSTYADATKIEILWNNIPQIEAGFADLLLPKINQIKIDYIKSSLNNDKSFSDPSLITIETGITSVIQVNGIRAFVDGTGSGLVDTYWNEFVIESDIEYDFRIYGVNDNSSRPLKYLIINNIKTLPIGVPTEPTSLSTYTITQNSIGINWIKPNDHDNNTLGIQTIPYIERYLIDYIGITSCRYDINRVDNLYTPPSTISIYTDIAPVAQNADTNYFINTNLDPGTRYKFEISAKNTVNNNFGDISDFLLIDTNMPIKPSLLNVNDLNQLDNLSELRNPYSSSGGYTIDGNEFRNPIININNVDDETGTNTRPIRTINATSIRNNELCGDISQSVSNLIAYGGLSNGNLYLNNSSSKEIGGFGQNPINGFYDNNKIRLVISNDQDYYNTSTSSSGFWKSFDVYLHGLDANNNYPPSNDLYTFQFEYYEYFTNTQIITNKLNFSVDNINTLPSINNIGFINEYTSSNFIPISGVYTYENNAIFSFRVNIDNIANYYLRHDKKHIDYEIKSSNNILLSNTLSILQTDMTGSSHYYYNALSPNYLISSTKHNTDGNVLIATDNPNSIQFNDFTIQLIFANSIFDEDFKIFATPYNLYGEGNEVNGQWINPLNGNIKKMRIDTKSILNNRVNSSYSYNISITNPTNSSTFGQRVRSGIDPNPTTNPTPNINNFPDIGTTANNFGDIYSNNESIIDLNNGYKQELQLVNGLYQGYRNNNSDGFIDYTDNIFYFPNNIYQPDYSSVSSDNIWRYATFKYQVTGFTNTTYERIVLEIQDNYNLTIDLTGFNNANHRLYLKVVGNPIWATGWLDCTNPISELGLPENDIPSDDTNCLDSGFSNNNKRCCFIKAGTTQDAIFYVRLGIRNNVNAYFSNISLRLVQSFS